MNTKLRIAVGIGKPIQIILATLLIAYCIISIAACYYGYVLLEDGDFSCSVLGTLSMITVILVIVALSISIMLFLRLLYSRNYKYLYMLGFPVLYVACIIFFPPQLSFRRGFIWRGEKFIKQQEINEEFKSVLDMLPDSKYMQTYEIENGHILTTNSAISFLNYDILNILSPAYLHYKKSDEMKYVILEWGGPLAGRYGILYEPKGREKISNYKRCHGNTNCLTLVYK